MRYLKTYFSAPFEMKFLRLNYLESRSHVDKFIVCEFNRTHTGAPRELIWDSLKRDYFSEEELKDIVYMGADISTQVRYSMTDGAIIHGNERLMRGYFASQIDLKSSDVVVAVDADEIIYASSYEEVISRLGFFSRGFTLNLHLFIYKLNYLWKDEPFFAPLVCRADFRQERYPASWRYSGRKYPGRQGCHFTWCMSIPDMVDKLKRYSHAQDHPDLADPVLLQKAVDEKRYPFEPERAFDIEVIDLQRRPEYFPKALYGVLDSFSDFVAEG